MVAGRHATPREAAASSRSTSDYTGAFSIVIETSTFIDTHTTG